MKLPSGFRYRVENGVRLLVNSNFSFGSLFGSSPISAVNVAFLGALFASPGAACAKEGPTKLIIRQNDTIIAK
ncbi:hypothetical protein [Bacillus canaveralius]|uniref:hypothetical protein n=1 Tax=Bacillus canaveralius TaxID=1403243 RepID=UPI0021AD606A|nr:hypothetical protein [Bacillus canaveralius]